MRPRLRRVHKLRHRIDLVRGAEVAQLEARILVAQKYILWFNVTMDSTVDFMQMAQGGQRIVG